MKGHRFAYEKIEGKMEEIEENRGLNDKKAYEDQFTTFVG